MLSSISLYLIKDVSATGRRSLPELTEGFCGTGRTADRLEYTCEDVSGLIFSTPPFQDSQISQCDFLWLRSRNTKVCLSSSLFLFPHLLWASHLENMPMQGFPTENMNKDPEEQSCRGAVWAHPHPPGSSVGSVWVVLPFVGLHGHVCWHMVYNQAIKGKHVCCGDDETQNRSYYNIRCEAEEGLIQHLHERRKGREGMSSGHIPFSESK